MQATPPAVGCCAMLCSLPPACAMLCSFGARPMMCPGHDILAGWLLPCRPGSTAWSATTPQSGPAASASCSSMCRREF